MSFLRLRYVTGIRKPLELSKRFDLGDRRFLPNARLNRGHFRRRSLSKAIRLEPENLPVELTTP